MASTSQLVSALNSTANAFASGVKTQADKMNAALNKIDSTVNNVDQKMTQLRKMIIEGEEKQLAHENVLQLEQRINEQLNRDRKSVV